jgi:hypothetical protein
MIAPDHERLRSGRGAGFFDSVSIDFFDGERDVCGILRLTRFPNRNSARVLALVFAAGATAEVESAGEGEADGESALVAGVAFEVLSPLERWRAEVARDEVSLAVEANAVSPAVSLLSQDASLAGLSGVESYEQLCELSGSVELGSRSFPLRCLGRRVHSWGETAWDRIEQRRSLYAVSDERRAILFESARPTGSGGHGDERRLARLVAAPDDIEPFEDARLSTVYGEDGLPAKANLELFLPGEEYPRRLGGEALHATWSDEDGARSAIGFFRWSMEGSSAFGLYEAVAPR